MCWRVAVLVPVVLESIQVGAVVCGDVWSAGWRAVASGVHVGVSGARKLSGQCAVWWGVHICVLVCGVLVCVVVCGVQMCVVVCDVQVGVQWWWMCW